MHYQQRLKNSKFFLMITRLDKTPRKGNEKDRGGGVMIEIRDTLSYRLTGLEVKVEEDNLTESITVENPIEHGEKLRITNMYVPPLRGREHTFKPDRRPSGRHGMILTDTNVHSLLWDRTPEKRGELLE